ncbi:hypothetical protein HA402_016071 [Bradysia odoriphaga]|nr:hypothetical protein HA402_016071 [Bradysia odoriphaga]
MQKFERIFRTTKARVIGMIHANALPGTPNYKNDFNQTIEKVRYEAHIYKKHNVHGILLENMHDIPYIQQDKQFNAETTACMTRLSMEIKSILPDRTPCGIQILACGNQQALAIAKATNLQFIRVEGFVFSHIADEGFTNANAGELLRYRKNIDAEDVLVFTDVKKKHSSHSITEDISLPETVKAAEFFLSDGVILTGSATGHAANPKDLDAVYGNTKVPILIGSGVTEENVEKYVQKANGLIIGSYFKNGGDWMNDLSEERVENFMNKVNGLIHG